MKLRLAVLAATAVYLLLTVPLHAVELIPVGVLGNSGEDGPRLVRVEVGGFHNTGGGVAAMRDGTLWHVCGDRVNHLTLNGALSESFPLRPQGSRAMGNTLAIANGRLYFLGRTPDDRPALFELPADGSAPAASIVSQNLPASQSPLVMAPQPLDGKLMLVADRASGTQSKLDVYAFNPAKRNVQLAFSIDGAVPQGVAVDAPHRTIYIGGRFASTAGKPSSQERWAIIAVALDGRPVSPAFPAVCPRCNLSPVSYLGHVNFAGAMLWDLAWYGYMARLDRQAESSPGTVELWHHELGSVSQIVDLGDSAGRVTDVLACATGGDEAIYLGHWNPLDQKMGWVRRIGCLPTINGLWITPEGWVSVGTSRTQLWWQFDDAADAAPQRACLHVAVTPASTRGDQCLAIGTDDVLADLAHNPLLAMAFTWKSVPNNEARRLTPPIPLKRPIGLTLENPMADGTGWLFVSDAATRKIWRTKTSRPELTPDNAQWQPLPYADPALEKLMETATDLASVPDGRLLAAIDGAIICLENGRTGYAQAWRLDRWGDTAADRFGRRLRFSQHGQQLLVADTDRHRLLLFDLDSRKRLAQAGQTDRPGSDLWHLYFPVAVSHNTYQAVVADTGNQRVLKLLLTRQVSRSDTKTGR